MKCAFFRCIYLFTPLPTNPKVRAGDAHTTWLSASHRQKRRRPFILSNTCILAYLPGFLHRGTLSPSLLPTFVFNSHAHPGKAKELSFSRLRDCESNACSANLRRTARTSFATKRNSSATSTENKYAPTASLHFSVMRYDQSRIR